MLYKEQGSQNPSLMLRLCMVQLDVSIKAAFSLLHTYVFIIIIVW